MVEKPKIVDNLVAIPNSILTKQVYCNTEQRVSWLHACVPITNEIRFSFPKNGHTTNPVQHG